MGQVWLKSASVLLICAKGCRVTQEGAAGKRNKRAQQVPFIVFYLCQLALNLRRCIYLSFPLRFQGRKTAETTGNGTNGSFLAIYRP